jgi:hypothetical protein
MRFDTRNKVATATTPKDTINTSNTIVPGYSLSVPKGLRSHRYSGTAPNESAKLTQTNKAAFSMPSPHDAGSAPKRGTWAFVPPTTLKRLIARELMSKIGIMHVVR